MDIETIKKINGTYGRSSKDAYINDIVKQYNYADENVITKFTALVNSNKGRKVTRIRKSIETPIRVLMEYKNNKNSNTSNFYIETKSKINDITDGDIISYYDDISGRLDYYLCVSKPMRERDYDINYVVNCNQTLNWKGLEKPIPCWCTDTAYNDKGEINLDYFSMVDGKVAVYVQVNEITNQIKQNMRFIFNHNPMMVFEAISIKNVTTPNIFKIVMKKTEYFKEKDDFENNIAYNDDILGSDNVITPTPSEGYSIASSSGLFDIRQYGASVFTVMNNDVADDGTWEITIDYNGVDTAHIKVESLTSNSIKIRNLKGLNENKLKIIFVKGDIQIVQEVGLIKS